MTVLAPAKVNFTLEVFGKRVDGYHALRSVVMPISLCDTLEIEPADSFSTDTGYADDLCLKAANALNAVRGRAGNRGERRGVSIHVTKRIPVGGGLGGGSADAAAVLLALNELWQMGLNRDELATIGAQVGSDVPSLVLGGPVLMEGRGEKVTSLASMGCSLRPFNLVLVSPGIHSSTAEVYKACTPRVPGGTSATDSMIAALRTGNFTVISAALQNDLQDPAVRLHPEIAKALESLRNAGATGVAMSGSGSCVFGIVPDADTAHRLSSELSAKGLDARPITTVPSNMI